MRLILIAALLAPVFTPHIAHAERWTGDASPLDGHRLIVLRTNQFTTESNSASEATQVKHKATIFGSAATLKAPLQATIRIRTEGTYVLWIRVGQTRRYRTPIQATIRSQGTILAQATIHGASKTESYSGRAGYVAYREVIEKFTSKLVANDPTETLVGDLIDELSSSKEQARRKWSNLDRLEDVDQTLPFYWWKLSPVELKPGEYTLALATQGRIPKQPPLIDSAFLTTNIDVPYPFFGDIDARPASYVRFQIDSLPPGKTQLGIRMGAQLHHAPWNTGASLAPNGINNGKPATHSNTGFTRWYRLQDIENFSGFGGATLSIALSIDPGAKGATEFAVFPHEDHVLRRFDWSEIDGKRLSMRTDFQTFPRDLRTLRDYARQHYQMAQWATRGQLFPLTRGPLYFANGGAGDSGAGNDYLVKTLRLLGFNSCAAPDNVANSRRYGWEKVGGQYWPPVWMPYNEEETAGRYRSHYARVLARRQQQYEGMGTFQIADEPGEIGTTELSAPLWLWQPAVDKRSAHWHDPTGASDLVTKKTDFSDCVLEGVLHCGTAFELRVGELTGEKPKFGYWRVGKPRNDSTWNLTAGVSNSSSGNLTRPGAVPSWNGVPFKIIYRPGTGGPGSRIATGSAALYCNDRLMAQLNGLPSSGGFAIRGGNTKSISHLRVRPVQKKEQALAFVANLDDKKRNSSVDDLLDEIASDGQSKSKFPPKPLKEFVEQDWAWSGGSPEAHVGFRKWLREKGLTPPDVGADTWENVRVMTIRSLATSPERRRQFYWSRRYANYLTPRMFAMAAEGIRDAAPNKEMKGYVALSGHALYLGSTAMPLDMFELARYPAMTPGVSDWMTSGGWRWDSHQAVAYSIAPYNAGARQYGKQPLTFPMMHCVYPSIFRAYTQLANQCKLISYWTYGPSYAMTEGYWSDSHGSHRAVHTMNNRSAQVDDLLGTAVMRPSRVAMLYSHSTHVWSSADSYHDKRATFLGLSHEYYQPELVTEEQISDGCLQHYDALYVLEPHVAQSVQNKISTWTRDGGLLWTSSNALTYNEFNEPADWLAREAAIQRTGKSDRRSAKMSSAEGQPAFQTHNVAFGRRYKSVTTDGAVTRAVYEDGSPAWIEKPLGQGRVIYVGHRAGVTYSRQSIALSGRAVLWADTGRATLTRPLHEAAVTRELVVSKPTVMATAQSTDDGTVIVLYNMRPESITPLTVTLNEATRPAVVQTFANDRLTDMPFEFADGQVTITLDQLHLHEGQMIVVRRNPAPADARLAVMKTRATGLLKSDDPLDLSAGAWFAGYHPEWQLGEAITPLLGHARWEVRRSAAEALGRLNHQPAASGLLQTVEQDTDNHVRADALHALALVDTATFVRVAPQYAQHENMIVRLETMRAIKSLLNRSRDSGTDESAVPHKAALLAIAKQCLSDTSQRVRHFAIELTGRLQPESVLQTILAESTSADDRTQWIAALAGHDAAFSQYLEQGMPGGDDLFYSIAQRRQDPTLASVLERRFESGEQHLGLMNAVEAQRNERLVRRVFQQRDQLNKTWQSRLTYQLETALGHGLGRDLNAWAERLTAK